MKEQCERSKQWINCLCCSLIYTELCPLVGTDALEKLENRLKKHREEEATGVNYSSQSKEDPEEECASLL